MPYMNVVQQNIFYLKNLDPTISMSIVMTNLTLTDLVVMLNSFVDTYETFDAYDFQGVVKAAGYDFEYMDYKILEFLPISGAIEGISSVTGGLSGGHTYISGTISAQSSVTGNLMGRQMVSGSITGTSNVIGALTGGHQRNLLPKNFANGSETGTLTDADLEGGMVATSSTTYSYGGSRSIKLAGSSPTFVNFLKLDYDELVPVTGSTYYVFSAHMYVDTMPENDLVLGVFWADSSKNDAGGMFQTCLDFTIGGEPAGLENGVWRRIHVQGQSPVGAAYARPYFLTFDDIVYVDYLQFELGTDFDCGDPCPYYTPTEYEEPAI